MRALLLAALCLLVPGAAALAQVDDTARARCTSHDPLRQAFFGDVHVHTSWSMDAATADVPGTPLDAYRFARGEAIELSGGRTARLERPLDFAAVSDHAEYLGEVSLCRTPGSPIHHHPRCRSYRGEDPSVSRGVRMGMLLDAAPPFVEMPPFARLGTAVRSPVMCGEDLSRCREAASAVWAASQRATEQMNDTSAECRFTALHAYEYTWTPQLSKIHRNVIFRSAVVPDSPTSSVEAPTPRELWQALERDCLEAGTGCDVLAIPHNPNLSNGRMFRLDHRDAPLDAQPALAAQQARLEPLVEIMQVKGDSECRNGLSGVVGAPDEHCDFEKFRAPDTPDCGDDTYGYRRPGRPGLCLAPRLRALRPGRGAARAGAHRRQPAAPRHHGQRRQPQRHAGRHGGALLRRRARQQRADADRSPGAGARRHRRADGRESRRAVRGVGRGEHARLPLRRDAAARDLRHQRRAHRAAPVCGLGLRDGRLRAPGRMRP